MIIFKKLFRVGNSKNHIQNRIRSCTGKLYKYILCYKEIKLCKGDFVEIVDLKS